MMFPQTEQVRRNLQKPRPLPRPVSTQQPLANRQRHVLDAQHETVRASFSCAIWDLSAQMKYNVCNYFSD